MSPVSSTLPAPRPLAGAPSETGTHAVEVDGHEHLVGVYDDMDTLVAAIVDLVAPGFEAGDGAVVVATEAHRRAVTAGLRERGIDVETQLQRGRLALVDAADLLAAISTPDGPDAARFAEHVGGLIDQVTEGGRGARLYGEMVTLLWNEGDVNGALALEDLWEAYLRERPATLLCGYPSDAFAHDRSTEAFRAVCDRHTAVVTTSVDAADLAARSRALALLEHERVVDRNRQSDLERQREALEDALVHLREATTRRDELSAIVVHDIRSPATMVTNALGLILQAGPDLGWEETRELLQTAHEAGERIVRLSRDIVTSAELDAGSFTYDLRPVDLVRIVADAVQEVRAATGRTVEFHHDLDLPAALADEVRQRQVLSNLLGNAVKFSPDDTTIKVSVTRAEDHLQVQVRDAGPGISPEDQSRLFQPFSRLDPARGIEGSGLGLHSAKLLTEGQGGTIRVDSELGQGALFTYTVLTLPAPDDRRDT